MRQMQAQAIDKRLKENEKRGVQDVDRVKQKIAKRDEYERRQEEAQRNRGTGNDTQLRVNN